MKATLFRTLLILTLTAMASLSARAADLYGNSISATWNFKTTYTQTTAVTPADGVELNGNFGSAGYLDIGHSDFLVSSHVASALSSGTQWIFTGIDYGSPFTVSVNTNLVGFNMNDVVVTANSITFTNSALISSASGPWSVDFVLTPVPEASTLAMMGLGLLVLGVRRARRC